ncbi:MAG TPA: 3-isopropylmalate dehydratase small subunit [Gemmatimonadaceae bacterium]|nr:3-isopropylmalate dehydratase small subunit [Gemmatimonadaceae bacterium]
MREGFRELTGRFVALRADDVDTDQIIPARFLTTTQRTGLGEHLFADWRRTSDGAAQPDFALNRPEARHACVLVAGRNFGCGSSREHAVWALTDAGFRAVVASSFADIFRANAVGNGLLPVQLPPDVVQVLHTLGAGQLSIDLPNQRVSCGVEIAANFEIDGFAKHCLLHGLDELEFLLGLDAQISTFEQTRDGRALDLVTT